LADPVRAEGLQLTGEGGLLAMLTKKVVESALEGEMHDHLGYAKHDRAGRDDSGRSSFAGSVWFTGSSSVGSFIQEEQELNRSRDCAGTYPDC